MLLLTGAGLADDPAWEVMTSGTTATVVGVYAASPADVYAVTRGWTDFRHWNGVAWSAMPCGNQDCITLKTYLIPFGMWGASPSLVLAYGAGYSDNGMVGYWNGVRWNHLGWVEHIEQVYDMWGTAANQLFAVGYWYIYRYNGSSWTPTSMPGLDLRCIWGTDPANVYVVGVSSSAPYDSKILKFNGSTWREIYSGPAMGGQALWGTDDCTIFLASGSKIYYYNGVAWSWMKTDGTATLNDIWGMSADAVFAVGDSGRITRFDGVRWHEMDSGVTVNLHGVSGAVTEDASGTVIDLYAVGDSGTILHCTFPYEPEVPEYAPTVADTPGNVAVVQGVVTATGEYTESQTDISLGGPLPLYFQRTYASNFDNDPDFWPAMGRNWSHNFNVRLFMRGCRLAKILMADGRSLWFEKTGQTWQLLTPRCTPYQLVESAAGFKLADPAQEIIYSFSRYGRLDQIADRNGNALVLTYDPWDIWGLRPRKVEDGLGRTLIFTFNGDQLTKVMENFMAYSCSYTYEQGNLVSFKNMRSLTTSYSYTAMADRQGLLTTVSLPRGNIPWQRTYDEQGRVASQTDSEGNTTRFAYDEKQAGETVVTDPLGYSRRYLYDAACNLIRVRDEVGLDALLTYDTRDRLVEETDRNGNSTARQYDEVSGRVIVETDALGQQTLSAYLAQQKDGLYFYDLTAVQLPTGDQFLRTPDPCGNPLLLTNPAGDTVAYTYNSRGQTLAATNAAGGLTTYAYDDASGMLVGMTDPAGETTSFSYDLRRRLSRITYADGASVQYYYGATDCLNQLFNANFRSIYLSYDDNDNLVTITEPLGKITTYTYDGLDRIIAEQMAGLEPVTYTYDERGFLHTVNRPVEGITTLNREPQGWISSVTDEAGIVAEFLYDAEGQIQAFRDGEASEWNFTLDELGRVRQIIDPLGNINELGYDSLHRLTDHQDPLDRRIHYDYGNNGLLADAVINPEDKEAAIRADYGQDPLGRLTSETDPNGMIWGAATDELGRLTMETNPLGQAYAYHYDSRNRLARVDLPSSDKNGDQYAEYTFDNNSNLRKIHIVGDGETLDLEYDYNDLNLLTETGGVNIRYGPTGNMDVCNGIDVLMCTHPYPYVGEVVLRESAPRIEIRYSFFPENRKLYVHEIRSDGVDEIWSTTYVYFNSRQQVQRIERPNGLVTEYRYDAAGRLDGIDEYPANEPTNKLSSISLTLNEAGELTEERNSSTAQLSVQLQNLDFSYNAASQINEFGHDTLGRVTEDTWRTYQWDLANRLRSYTRKSDQETVVLTYTDLALLETQDVSGQAARFNNWNYAFDLPAVSQVWNASGDLWYYVHLPDGSLLHRIDAHNPADHNYYHFDHNGHTIFLSDDEGRITDTYMYAPFGQLLARGGQTDNPFTFMGRYNVMSEGESGLYFMHGRWFDSRTCRFLSPPPRAMFGPQGMNPYAFRENKPGGRGAPGIGETGYLSTMLSRLAFDPNAMVSAAATGAEWLAERDIARRESIAARNLGDVARRANLRQLAESKSLAHRAEDIGKKASAVGSAMGALQEWEQCQKEGQPIWIAALRSTTVAGAGWAAKWDFTGVVAEGVSQVVRVPTIIGGRCSSRAQMAYTDMIRNQFVMGMAHDLGERFYTQEPMVRLLEKMFRENGRTFRVSLGRRGR
ncbi:MAG: hypothetical protein JXQ27_04545 [Acidobacteria bacterium]|nr:hypothetical protein [Acidobacteriota bacterium]